MSNSEPSLNVIIDHAVPITVSVDTGIFEISTLMSLEMGLTHIALTVWRTEEPFRRGNNARTRTVHPDTDLRMTRMLECHFHWFGVSLCNYVSLVGFLASLHNGAISRKDLETKEGRKRIAAACKTYVKRVPEIRDVLLWRNKAVGVFSIHDTTDNDNLVTFDMAPMHPVSFVARRYRVRQWDQGKRTRGVRKDGFSPWSITEVYERLASRYWPSFRWPAAEAHTASRTFHKGLKGFSA